MLTLKLLLILTILLTLNLCGRGDETTTTTTAESDDESNDEDEEIDPEIPLWHLFDCNRIFESGPRPVHKEKDWILMRKAYKSIVSADKSSIPTQEEDEKRSGFHVAFEARQADEKGRGIFAKEGIKKGQKVWSTLQTARFDDGNEYRKFLSSIPADFACDVVQWAYVQAVNTNDKREKAFISVDLDPGSFINAVEEDYETDETPNVGCDETAAKADPGGCKHNYYALRDIDPDDEIILEYGDFAITDGWRWFGLNLYG